MMKDEIRTIPKTNNINRLQKRDYAKIIYGNIPEKYRKKLEKEATYAGLEPPIYKYVTNIMKTSYIIMIFILTITKIWLNLNWYITFTLFVATIFIGFAMPYIVFTVSAEKRTKEIEKYLPDLLMLTASNIKSGLTIDKALLFSARHEFGALSTEVLKTAFKIYGGIQLETAFKDMTKRINSGHLKRTVKLLLEGIKSGGNTATLLEESATDIENSKILQKEINASIQMYIIFIILAGVIAAPVMFAISNYLIESTTGMWSNVDTDKNADVGAGILTIKPTSSSIDSEFFTFFATAAISITTIFGGMLISLIKFGNLKHSVKYSPIFTIVAISLFYIAKAIVTAAMSGL
ncbi:MAG: type II secretion system F family protein [archaeon]|nr:type II secretion system F family protein [archaeon]